MSWARLDDQMAFHAKIIRAGNEAVGAWVRMLAHCCAHLTDGLVDRDVALQIAPQRVIDRAVKARLLDVDGENYRVHDFHDWNPPAEHVRTRREAERLRKAYGRAQQGRAPSGRITAGVRTDVRPDGAQDSARSPHACPPVPSPVPVPDPKRDPPVAPLAEAAPRTGRIPDGLVNLERPVWVSVYEDAVRSALGGSWSFPPKQWSALRAVVEAHCQGEDRKDIPGWIGRDVGEFVRAVRTLDEPDGVWSAYGPDGLQRWHNRQKPGVADSPSATRIRVVRGAAPTQRAEGTWTPRKANAVGDDDGGTR